MKKNKEKTWKVIRLSRRDIAPLKRAAREFAELSCAHFAKLYGVAYKKIRIGAARSRWGSCSSTGTLSFNYKIAALPPELARYIIVHEVCHLAEMNHSPRFWVQVARSVPEHRARRKELRSLAFIFR